jgi:osmotically-inducible protein OsmY
MNNNDDTSKANQLPNAKTGSRDLYYGNVWGTQRDRSYGQDAPYFENYSDTWMQAGPHTGRGPKGYQRADATIQEEACERLTQHGYVDASNITVRVEAGEITLEGTVNSRREKRMAEDALENLSGMRDIHNRLRVQRPDPEELGVSGEN